MHFFPVLFFYVHVSMYLCLCLLLRFVYFTEILYIQSLSTFWPTTEGTLPHPHLKITLCLSSLSLWDIRSPYAWHGVVMTSWRTFETIPVSLIYPSPSAERPSWVKYKAGSPRTQSLALQGRITTMIRIAICNCIMVWAIWPLSCRKTTVMKKGRQSGIDVIYWPLELDCPKFNLHLEILGAWLSSSINWG